MAIWELKHHATPCEQKNHVANDEKKPVASGVCNREEIAG